MRDYEVYSERARNELQAELELEPSIVDFVDWVVMLDGRRGCPCACHGLGDRRREVYHVAPCHEPMLKHEPWDSRS